MTIDQFIAHLETYIEGIEPGSLRPATDFKALPPWDSLALLTTLAMVDAEYGITISGNEITASATIQDLFNLVKSKKQ